MKYKNKKLIVFDLDGTLADARMPMTPENAEIFAKLIEKYRVAVISGGGRVQFEVFLGSLPKDILFKNLFLFPTCGAIFLEWKDGWRTVYEHFLSESEKKSVFSAFDFALERSERYKKPKKIWGEQIDDRGAQITFSGLGQDAPSVEKSGWDPEKKIRFEILSFLEEKLPDFAMTLGGSTSIDVCKRGFDKKYGLGQMRDRLGVNFGEMFFVGDAIFPGGNDFPAAELKIDYFATSGPTATADFIKNEFLS